MAAIPYLLEKKVAISAVTRACYLTSSLFASLQKSETITKSDTSPVTIGDFSAQAAVNSILNRVFPHDSIIGEEDSKDLRGDEGKALRERVTQLANEALQRPIIAGLEETPEWGIGESAKRSSDELLDALDRGTAQGGSQGRTWCLDPIDGTKGFLRGNQYAVCLALVVDGTVQLGVIGCPNLSYTDVSSADITPGQGSIYVAVRGQGAEKYPFPPPATPAPPVKLSIPANPSPPFRLLESFEKAHSNISFGTLVGRSLGITEENAPLRMDSQAKYCAVAAQNTGGYVYLRMPVPGKNYIEKIWDHAAGSVIIEEAGGAISDSYGNPLNFGLGRTLGENKGIVATAKGEPHAKVIRAIAEAREVEEKMKLGDGDLRL